MGRTLKYDLRNKHEYEEPFSKTKRSSNAYFTNALHEWNLIDESVRNSATLAEFKRKLLNSINRLRTPCSECSISVVLNN